MRHSLAVLAAAAFIGLAACGDKAETKAADFGDVAFATYEAEGFRVVFTNDTKVVKTWRNMSGGPVNGTYKKTGNEIDVQWDAKAEHHGSVSEKFRQTGPCALARYVRIDRKGVKHDESPQIYQKTKPRCDTVRITK